MLLLCHGSASRVNQSISNPPPQRFGSGRVISWDESLAIGLIAWLCGLRAWEHLGSAETSALGEFLGGSRTCVRKALRYAAETIAAADENTRVSILDGVGVRSIRPGKGMGWCYLRIGRG